MSSHDDDPGCPRCGKPSASPPAEVYCVECATEGWEQDAAAHRAVMAGDGGRVPDVSEQRAEALYDAVERGATALCRFVFPGYLVPRIEMARAVIDAYNDDHDGWMDRLPPKRVYQQARRPQRSDPASVLAALLAESPEATVAAIEALLTSDEAVSAYRRAYLTSPPHGVKHDHAARMEHERAGMRAAARSLLSKAPKEDGDARGDDECFQCTRCGAKSRGHRPEGDPRNYCGYPDAPEGCPLSWSAVRSSPSRDGTVAVEDVRAWLQRIEANDRSRLGGLVFEFEREFGPARAGESNEGDNQ